MRLLFIEQQYGKDLADDLWYDLLGMMKVQGTDLNIPFLTQQAALLSVNELLARALVDAGLRIA